MPEPARCRCSRPVSTPALRSPSCCARCARTSSRRRARRRRRRPLEIPHGTTVVAIRYADGVVMAGDRRATAGYTIASRRIEKVFAADDFSGVAIAGAAGPAIEMVKLFQTQLEHYEKVQGDVLSLEGKANQLGMLVRGNLPAAMQGFAVVPLFAGYDHAARDRPRVLLRRHRRPLRGARLPGAGLRQRARPQLDQGRLARGHDRSTTTSSSRSVRCSPPPTKTSPPADPTSCAASSRRSPRSTPTGSARSTDAEVERAQPSAPRGPGRGEVTTSMNMPFYVSPEQVMKDRADYARKGIARGRSLVALECAPGVLIVADNPSRTLSKISEIYDRIAFAAVGQVQRVPDAARRRRAPRRPQGLLVLARRRVGQGARERVRADARPDLHARDEAVRGRAARRRGRPRAGDDDAEMYHILYDGVVMDEQNYSVLGGNAEQITEALKQQYQPTAWISAPRCKLGAKRARRRRASRSAPTSSRSRCSTARGRGARSAASRTPS